MNEHKEIYLEPKECSDPDTGPMWCQDSQSCNNCGKSWIKYVMDDIKLEKEQIVRDNIQAD